MAGRILGGSCGNVRLFSVPPPLLLFFSLFLRVLHAVLLFLHLLFFSSLANPSFFSIWADSTIRSSLASVRPPPRLLLVPFARSSSSSRLAAFGYHLGHRGHPPRCTRYVVCPIFTHGKSTLKRRWAPARAPLFPPSALRLRSFSILHPGCFSISADRVKIGSQRSTAHAGSFLRESRFFAMLEYFYATLSLFSLFHTLLSASTFY